MGMVKIEIRTWLCESLNKMANGKEHITIEEEIKPGISFLSLVDNLSERYTAFSKIIFDRVNKRFYSHVVVMLNGRVANTSEILEKVPQDGDRIVILPLVAGG